MVEEDIKEKISGTAIGERVTYVLDENQAITTDGVYEGITEGKNGEAMISLGHGKTVLLSRVTKIIS